MSDWREFDENYFQGANGGSSIEILVDVSSPYKKNDRMNGMFSAIFHKNGLIRYQSLVHGLDVRETKLVSILPKRVKCLSLLNEYNFTLN